ncbi:helix-turn-helix domain-containing protein [Nonomuraea candida]|uniref:helix-turn-helix domain-containing protein n=1 Tax=Nonomuraea candida TaxID=359159 RepID=UPI00069492FA|nr:helix-turn-helix transcriptional regulator [Nonomuraea candida]
MVDLYTPQAIWGRELRHYRKAAGLTQGQLSERIHFSEGLISGIETGRLPASFEFARSCDSVLNTGGALYRLLDWRKGPLFPSWFEPWDETEKAAVALRSYQPLLIPGLLQTERYARALLRGDETLVAARMARQALLTREDPPPPALRYIIDESVLYRPVETAGLMREQLQRLLDAVNPRLSIQLLPHGMHAGLMGGFVIATMKDDFEVAYVETLVRGIATNVREDVALVLERYETIRTQALPQAMSLDLIKKAMEEKWT